MGDENPSVRLSVTGTDLSIKGRLHRYVDELSVPKKRGYALEKIARQANTSHPQFDYDDSILTLKLLTGLLLDGSELTSYQRRCSKGAIEELTKTLSVKSERQYPNQNKSKLYFDELDFQLNKFDISCPSEEKPKRLFHVLNLLKSVEFSEPANEFVQRLSDTDVMQGKNFKISRDLAVASEWPSLFNKMVAFLPENPAEAAVSLGDPFEKTQYDEKSKISENFMPIFSEYHGENSAEEHVFKIYGTDGKIAERFWNFLDLRNKYPSQNHLYIDKTKKNIPKP